MVEAHLTKELIEAGATLVRKLDEGGRSPDAAFWLYSPENQAWKLILVEVKLVGQGPKAAYAELQDILTKHEDELAGLRLHDLVLERPDAPLVELLRRAIRTGRSMKRIRFTNNVINGILIPDALIYRVN